MRYGWLLLPGSFGPRRRTLHRPVCSASRERSGGRKASRWVTACVVSEGCPGRSPPARHLCTTPPLGSAAPLLYSWEWRARLWRRSGRRDAPQSGAGSPPDADGILEETEDMKFRKKEQKPDKWHARSINYLVRAKNECCCRNEEWDQFGVAFLSSLWTIKISVMWRLCPTPMLYRSGFLWKG